MTVDLTAHPQMFDDDDPFFLGRVRELAGALPGIDMKVLHGRPADSTDRTEIAELLDSSYRLTAPAKLIAELDARD